MAKEKKLGEGPMDEDTKEILEEMEAEGIDTSTITGGKKVVQANSHKDDEAEEEPDLDDEEDDTEDESESEDEESEEDEEDEPDVDEEEESDEDSDEDKEKPEGKLTLVQKYRKVKKHAKELETTLATLQTANSEEAFDKELKVFAEKSGMNIEVAKGFLELAAKKAGLPKDLMDDIQKSRQERRNNDYWSSQHKAFDKDFKSNVKPVLENLGLDEDQIAEVRETLNGDDKSAFWAWDKKNKSTSLVKLALQLQRKGNSRTSSEGRLNKSLNRGKSAKQIDEMTAEDIDDMSDEDFDKWSDGLGKNQKSVVHRA